MAEDSMTSCRSLVDGGLKSIKESREEAREEYFLAAVSETYNCTDTRNVCSKYGLN